MIKTIDCNYLEPGFAAAYLLLNGDEAAFIDNNTAHSVPLQLQALRDAGIRPEQVRWIIITHVHLDHAGGTSALLEHCPNAQVIAHPRAAVHLVDPSKLIISAEQVYGSTRFKELYGEIKPIDAGRVQTVGDEEKIQFGNSQLKFLHTRGHANHHFCIFHAATDSIFTGDAFGLAYPALQSGGLFIFPSTSPTDFDYEEAVKSIDRIVETRSASAYLTHFGEIRDLKGAAAQLKTDLRKSADLFDEIKKELDQGTEAEVTQNVESRLWEHYALRINLDLPTRKLMQLDIELNAAGLVFAAKKRLQKERQNTARE